MKKYSCYLKYILLAGFVLFLFIENEHAYARIYTFIDEAGTIHFSNVPTDVRYRPAGISYIREPKNYSFYQSTPDIENPYKYDAFIRTAAMEHEVDPLLVKAIIKAESNFNHRAVSKTGAVGLMQLMPDTASEMKVNDPFDPEQNINGGTKYFRKLLGMFKGDLHLSLAAYNAGPNRVKLTRSIPNISETTRYVKKVLSNYERYKATSPPRKRWVKFSY